MSGHNPFRLPQGGRIDRSRTLRFTFEGREYTGYEGDTLASALIANGVRLVGRSFKYHRPRGIIGAGVEEPNALMQVGLGARSTANLRATEVRLFDELSARAVNSWPNVRFDVGGVNNLMSRFFAAGFYYKTFMWPSWHLYEGVIRRAAGLGKVAKAPDPDRYEVRHAHCDILVVGAGPAGLAAAAAAARTGQRVILAELDSCLGGQLLFDGGEIDGQTGSEWVAQTAAFLRDQPNVDVMLNTAVTGYFDHNSLSMVETVAGEEAGRNGILPRYRQWDVRAGRVILATGAIERPLVFPGNDRPGVMLASAARHYVGRYAAIPGKRAVIFTNNDEGWRTAVAFHEAGGEVAAIVDSRQSVSPVLRNCGKAVGAAIHLGSAVVETRGRNALKSIRVRTGKGCLKIACDLLAVSGGRSPTVHLFSQSGGRLTFDAQKLMFVPERSVQREVSVGAAAGGQTLAEALASGHAAGLGNEPEKSNTPPKATLQHDAPKIEACWSVDAPGKAFVDFLNDVTADDIALSARESFVSVEHLKRYTTLGMGTDQGKTSNINALAIMAGITGKKIGETGTTRYRYPYVPVALGTFAGRAHGDLIRPQRLLPMHEWHVAHGGDMDDYGWRRPAAYLRPGENRHDASLREARAVRHGVGFFDGSPLGKIEVRGPDAAKFLDFIYANTMSTLKPGRIRYGLMLNEMGVIIDDGVCARLGDDHFLVGTSSAGADSIAAWLEEWLQCEFLDYDVLVAPVTTSWAVITLTGPKARDLLALADTDIDISSAAFPHMSLRTGNIAGVPARIFRVSYTGETSYEINVPVRAAADLWQKLFELGRVLDGTPIGIEAWNLLRLEKGYMHPGADTDGTSTPLNVGWNHVMNRKADFVGKRSLLLPVNQRPDPLELVGLQVDDAAPLPIGAHLVVGTGPTRRSDGFVTSSSPSVALPHPVALALVHGGRRRMGETVSLDHCGKILAATICDPLRYDPQGVRLNA